MDLNKILSMKNRVFQSILSLALFLPVLVYSQGESFLKYVDPNIGAAHSRWFFYTPAANPFGMAKPGPSTNASFGNKYGWEATGYDQRDESIECFVNLHEFQIGGISLMATIGDLQTVPGSLADPESGYRSRFSHDNEVSEPGYYKVFLDDYGVMAELTSTPRVAIHRYTFPESENSHIIFDIGSRRGESGKVIDAFVHRTGSKTVEGFVITLPEYIKNYQPGAYMKMYFVAETDKEPNDFGTFIKEEINKGISSVQGVGAGMYFSFNSVGNESVTVRIGLSYTSVENAKLNLREEAGEMDFDTAREKAQSDWNNMLGRITVKGGSETDKTKFYTGLYHAILGRGLASDYNGQYMKNNGDIGQIGLNEKGRPKYNHYNTDGVWGAFWNLTQLWGMAYPDYFEGFVNCQLDVYNDCGWLPDGIAASKFVAGVGTNYVGLVVASAYTRGIVNDKKELAFEAVKKNETGWQNRPAGTGRMDNKVFVEKGYVPYDTIRTYYSGSTSEASQFSASHTLEYSFGAYAAAQFAKILGKEEDYNRLTELSKGWEILYDYETKFIRPRGLDGVFIDDFDPMQVWRGFQEGNAHHYTFYVPHDPIGLMERIGKEKFNSRLNSVFEKASKKAFSGGKGENIDAFSGLETLYNHGNQPSLHVSWLFNYSGAPWLTQKWVRAICDDFYGTDGIHGYGYGQDEDQGQLGAWYVLAGMGLFDIKGGTDAEPSLSISAPLFNEIKIKLHPDYYKGDEFVINVKGNRDKNIYIKSAKLNGKDLNSCIIGWDDFTNGGVLDIITSKEPNKKWGIGNQ